MTLKKILIVDDEDSICSFLKVSLEAHSYQVRIEHDGKSAIQAAIDYRPDLVILDLGLPDMSGFSVLSKIREWSTLPVVVLTVQDSVEDKVKALDQGADDYLTKPFSVPELLARVRVALRHHENKDGSPQFIYKNLEVDLSSQTVKLDGSVVSLTATEYDILKVLIKYAGKVVTHRNLLKEVWGPNLVEHTQYLRVYVGHLRKKLKTKSEEDFIVTEPGVGYRFLA
jgi:two-component system KDP operon response regulator KdpE